MDNFEYNLKCLDNYDFEPFLSEGRSFYNIVDTIEEQYDKDCKQKNSIYIFEYLDYPDILKYLTQRYNIHWQPYTDWVVRRKK